MLSAQLVGLWLWMVTLWSPVKVVFPTVSRSIVPDRCTDHDTEAPWTMKSGRKRKKNPVHKRHLSRLILVINYECYKLYRKLQDLHQSMGLKNIVPWLCSKS